METFVVIGLGRFGSAVAEELCALGHQVLAIDTDEARVQQMADKVTQAVTGDCRDMDVLRALGVMCCEKEGYEADDLLGTMAGTALVMVLLAPLPGLLAVAGAAGCFFYYRRMSYARFGGITGEIGRAHV